MSDLVSDHWRGERSEKDLYPKVFEVEIMCEDTKMVLNTCYYLLSANVTGFQLLVILIPVMSSALLFTFVMGIIAGHQVTWWLTFTINYLLGKYLCFSCCNWNFLMLLPLFQHLHFSWLLNNFEAWWKIWCNRSIALHLLPLNYSIKVSSSSERILLNLKI